MVILRFLAVFLFAGTTVCALGACNSTHDGHSTVKSTGTPVNPFADPGGANQSSAPLTGAQPQRP